MCKLFNGSSCDGSGLSLVVWCQLQVLHLDDSTLSQSFFFFFINQTKPHSLPPHSCYIVLSEIRERRLLSQRETQSAAHLVSALWSLLMLRWSCRKSGCACRLSGSISVEEEGGGERRAVNVCVCVDSERAQSEGSLGADRSAHGMACESHAPSTAVQWRSCWEMSQPLETAQPRPEQLCRPAAPTICCCRNTRSLFISPPPSGNTLYQAFVYLSQRLMRMTHQKTAPYTVSLCGSSCWLYSVVSFGRHQERIFNLVWDLHEACLTLSSSSTCCQEFDYTLHGNCDSFFVTGPLSHREISGCVVSLRFSWDMLAMRLVWPV